MLPPWDRTGGAWPARGGGRRRQAQSLFQPIDVMQHLLLQPDHSGARLP